MLGNGWGGAETSEYNTDLTVIFGKRKVSVALASCSTVIAFIRASAALHAWSLFSADEALCALIMTSASVAAEAGVEGVSTETLKYICLKAIF